MNLQEDQKIRELFQQLKQADEKLTPSFPELDKAPELPSPWRRSLIFASALASVLLIAALWAFSLKKPDSQPSTLAGNPRPVEVAVVTGKTESASDKQSERPVRRAGGTRKAAPSGATPARFLPLASLDELPPLESATVVRVELSPASLRSIGFTVEDNSNTRPVQAELVIGQDGLARAIRIMPGNTAGADR